MVIKAHLEQVRDLHYMLRHSHGRLACAVTDKLAHWPPDYRKTAGMFT